VATLGYGPKMVKIVERVAPHDPHGVLASCALRLLHQFSNSKSIVKSIMAQCEVVKPVGTLKSTLVPLHKDAPFTFEIIRKMVEENSVQATKRDSVSSAAGAGGGGLDMGIGGGEEHVSAIVQEALDPSVDLVTFLTCVLDGTAEGADKVSSEDMGICKVHTVEILNRMENDAMYGADVRAKLDTFPVWEEYRHQKHDLFMSSNETKRQDYYLTYGASYGPAGQRTANLLEDVSASWEDVRWLINLWSCIQQSCVTFFFFLLSLTQNTHTHTHTHTTHRTLDYL
jgi:hypothetical protein